MLGGEDHNFGENVSRSCFCSCRWKTMEATPKGRKEGYKVGWQVLPANRTVCTGEVTFIHHCTDCPDLNSLCMCKYPSYLYFCCLCFKLLWITNSQGYKSVQFGQLEFVLQCSLWWMSEVFCASWWNENFRVAALSISAVTVLLCLFGVLFSGRMILTVESAS